MTTNLALKEMLGLQPFLSNEDYHAAPGVSASGLARLINETPAHFRAYMLERPEPTPAMLFGTALHTAILEPSAFDITYVRKPDGMSFATKEGKAWREINEGKPILSADDFDRILLMRERVMKHRIAGPLLSKGAAESSYFWTDPKTGVACKCRPDFISGTTLVDVKTAERARERDFQRSIVSYGYEIQTAFYLRGLSEVTGETYTDFVHVVIEKAAPFEVVCYVLDDASIEKANEIIDVGLETYASCLRTNTWPGYPQELIPINLPHWAF